MGQGTGDACSRWVIGSDSMSDAYSAEANGWELPSPFPTTQQKQALKAFIDNVNLFAGQPPTLQRSLFTHWHKLI